MYIKMKKELLSEILRLNSLISKQIITENVGLVRKLVTKIINELPKLSDEFATTFKPLMKQWVNKEIDAIKFLDEIFSVAKGSPYEKELLDTITPIIGRNISKDLGIFKNFIRGQFADQVPQDELTKVVMELWDDNSFGIEPIDDYIKRSLRKEIDDVYGVVQSTTTKTGILTKIGKYLQTWIPENIRTIKTAYSKLFKDLDTIKKQMDDVVKEMVEAKSKNQAVDISEFVKRLQDLAASGVKKKNSTFEGLWNEMVRNNSQLKTNSTLQREILKESSKLETLMLKETGMLQQYLDAWGGLFNIKNLFRDPKKWAERLANFIIQASPYTSEEIAKRIRTYGLKQVLAKKLIRNAISTVIVLPTLAGVLTAILGAGTGLIDWFRMGALGYEEEWFDLSKQNMKENFKDGFMRAFPDDFWDVALFVTYFDDVWNMANDGIVWKAINSVTPEQREAAEAGMKILKGEVIDIEGYEVQKTSSVHDEIKKLYPEIPVEILARIVVKSNDTAYYNQNTIEDGIPKFTPIRLSIVDGKVYLNNDSYNVRIEINTLWK